MIKISIPQFAIDTCNKKHVKTAFVMLIFAVALIIRLYFVLENPVTYKDGFGGYVDPRLYHKIAYNLYSGNGFSGIDNGAAYGLAQEKGNLNYKPVIVRGPVYPFFIYIVYKFFSDPEDMKSIQTWHKNWNKVRVAQAILDATVCIFVFFIVRAICPTSFWPAIISACLYSFSLSNIFYTKILFSESVSTFILSAAILVYIKALQKKALNWWIGAGMGFGMTVLSRPEYSLSIFVLAVFMIIVNRNSYSDTLKKSLIFIISAFIVISPWTIRNLLVFKKLILVSESGLGYSLYNAAVDNSSDEIFTDKIIKNKEERNKMVTLQKEYIRISQEGTIEFTAIDSIFMKKALGLMRENPAKTFHNWISGIPRLWHQNQGFNVEFHTGFIFIFHCMFAVYAFFRGKREEKILMGPVFLLFIYLTLIFLPMFKEPRYGVALIPGIISLSGIGIWKVISSRISLMEDPKARHL